MTRIEQYQEEIIKLANRFFPDDPITPETQTAFRDNPRHEFVRKYQQGDETFEITSENLDEHLPTIYRNDVIGLFKDEKHGVYSTISQPTLVLRMLDLLRLEPGHRVFELGAGSGWNAAMMGSIVGSEGKVYSKEIIPEIAKTAESAIADLGIENVRIIEGDAGEGYSPGAPYDRAVFTAGTYDLPGALHEQVREGGYLLVVIKVEGGGDQMFLLEKKKDHFESIHSMLCAFVPLTGKHALASADPMPLDSLSNWNDFSKKEVDKRRFWWGGDEAGSFWITLGFRSFLSISEPRFRVFTEDAEKKSDPTRWFFGLLDSDSGSLVIARKGFLVTYGSPRAKEILMERLHLWIDLGMPSMASMDLRISPIDSDIESDSNQWIVRKRDSQFLWSLKANDGAEQ